MADGYSIRLCSKYHIIINIIIISIIIIIAVIIIIVIN